MDFDWGTVIVAIIAAIPATIAAIQSRSTHLAINSRMTELLELARRESAAQATLDEKQAERNRQGDAAASIAKSKEVP